MIAGKSHGMLFTCSILILLAALFGLPSSAQSATLKSVQTGTFTFNGLADKPVPITTVDTTKAFLVFGVSENQLNGWDGQVTGQITNATTLTFSRAGNNNPGPTVKWYVAEFTSGVSVQRGNVNMAGIATGNATLTTAVDTSKSFPIVSFRCNGGTTFGGNDFLKAKLTTSTNLQLAFQTNGDGTAVAEWQVVEYTDSTVTSADVSFAAGDSSKTATVSISDLSKAWLIYTYNTADGTGTNIGQKLVQGQITNATTLTFDRNNTGQVINLTWYLVQFTDATTVQYASAAFTPAATTQVDVTITGVTTGNSIAAGGYIMRGGRSPDNTQGEPGVGWFNFDLTSSTNLRITRGQTTSTADVGWFVVQFSTTEATSTLEQEGFRFRADDGSQTGATWLANQDTDIARDKNLNTRLRMLVNAGSDPASTQYQLEYKNSTDATWQKVDAAPSQTESIITTTGAGTWQAPLNVTSVTVEAWGGGGAGGGRTSNGAAGGGGGGAYSKRTFSVTPGSTCNYSVAALVNGGTGNGSTGNTTWFMSNDSSGCVAVGGIGGQSTGAGGAGGQAGSGYGDLKYSGGTGGTSGAYSGGGGGGAGSTGAGGSTSDQTAGTGTSEFGGDGGAGRNSNGNGNPGTVYGGGGGGAYRTSFPNKNGGGGAQGQIRITYTPNPAITLSPSTQFADGDSTTAQLTPPSGKTTGNFTAGEMQESMNPGAAVDIANAYYTELGWCLTATDTAQYGDVYQFRVTANGVALDSYSVTPQWTIQLPAPVATAATNVQTTSFSANWGAVAGATGYRLDVATDSGFTAFVTGYNNLNVGNVTTYSVNSNITDNTTYYYRLRAYNGSANSASSNTISVIHVSGNFLYRKPITIPDSMTPATCGSNLSNFPLLVSVNNDARLKTVAHGGHVQNASGNDIIFRATDPAICTDTGNPAPCTLDHEIETYDGSAGTLIAWVRIPTLKYNASSTIYMYYDNAAVNSATTNPTGVWDGNFIGVWHLKEKPSDTAPQFKDSTSLQNDGTQNNMVDTDQQQGKVGGSIHFNGTNAKIPTKTGASVKGLTQFTISAWVNADTLGDDIYEECLNIGTNTRVKFLISGVNGNKFTLRGRSPDGGGLTDWAVAANAASTGTWYYAAGVFDSVADVHHLMVNGVDTTKNVVTDAITNSEPSLPPAMGSRATGGEYWQGYIDEFRISNTARSVCWLGTEYNSMATPASVGAEESSGVTAVTLLEFTAVGDGSDVKVGWQTTLETQNMGFDLYRSESREGPYEKLTPQLIPGGFDSPGGSYGYTDKGLVRGRLYYYLLEDVDVHGRVTRHGPICVDWDGDGLPDDWEMAYGLNPRVNDAALDSDGDGVPNWLEYARGTDPFNPDSDGDGVTDGGEKKSPGYAGGPSIAGADASVQVIASDAQGMTLELLTPDFDATPVAVAGQEFERLRVPAYVHGFTVVEGAPQLPQKGLLLDVPAGRTARLTVLESDSRVLPGYRVFPAPAHRVAENGELLEEFRWDEAAYRSDSFSPQGPAELSGTVCLPGPGPAAGAVLSAAVQPGKR